MLSFIFSGKDCTDGTGAGAKYYTGTKSVTRGGYTCQRWDKNSPHKKNPTFSIKENFPEKDLTKASNYCRQPSATQQQPWCYTTSSRKRWDYCDVPRCKGENNIIPTFCGLIHHINIYKTAYFGPKKKQLVVFLSARFCLEDS